MNQRTLRPTGVIGALVDALCCFTPISVIQQAT